ncbi:17730_t:CDS:2 [Gigaspora margarita]|uniref:17730_t:CDS:1 n=1 Tax=Gigaspora margarita TaxID=4874 RepID=A0ABN7UGB3_GIGMA|nr:17730_t:CDS:2 [Gigaspora margarita]
MKKYTQATNFQILDVKEHTRKNFREKYTSGSFFNELVLSMNLSQKSNPEILLQLLFVCYILCALCNKFIINAKHDLALYLDSISTTDITINTWVELGIISIKPTVWHKKNISKDHTVAVNNNLKNYNFECR